MTPTRRPRQAAALLGLLALGAACGGGDGGPADTAETRRPMPSCGEYVAPTGELGAEDRAVRDCFLSAYREGREAEVTITVSSLEGDAITTVYRVLGPNDLELFVDASADRFAAVDTYRQRCTSVAEEGAALAAGGCVVG